MSHWVRLSEHWDAKDRPMIEIGGACYPQNYAREIAYAILAILEAQDASQAVGGTQVPPEAQQTNVGPFPPQQ